MKMCKHRIVLLTRQLARGAKRKTGLPRGWEGEVLTASLPWTRQDARLLAVRCSAVQCGVTGGQERQISGASAPGNRGRTGKTAMPELAPGLQVDRRASSTAGGHASEGAAGAGGNRIWGCPGANSRASGRGRRLQCWSSFLGIGSTGGRVQLQEAAHPKGDYAQSSNLPPKS